MYTVPVSETQKKCGVKSPMRHFLLSSTLLFVSLSSIAAAQTWTYQGTSSCFHYGSNVQCFENGTIKQYATSQDQLDAAFKSGQETGQGVGMLIRAWMAHRRHLELERKDVREQITEYHRATYDVNDEISGYDNAELSALNQLIRLDPFNSASYEQSKASTEKVLLNSANLKPTLEKGLPIILAAKDMKFLKGCLERSQAFYNQLLEISKKQYVFTEFLTAYAESLEANQNSSVPTGTTESHSASSTESELPNLKILAESGNADAQVALAKMYREGSGVTQNAIVAAQWFQSAANLGQTEAQLAIGELLEQGRGVAQDYVHAHMWYNLAAAAGVSEAEARRNSLATKMTPEQLAEAQKLASQWRPTIESK
jgi:hypothetical protein